jgi:hypothetical protein
MKRLWSLLAVIATLSVNAQTKINAISDTGKIGIGVLNPTSRLHVFDNNRNYYVNRPIPGQTSDSQGANYLLLHEVYTTTNLEDRHVIGKITGIRGLGGSSNRKWTMEVNTSSAYSINLGSLITYNEMARLVTVVYNGTNYLAVEILNGSTLYYFSFTGYASYAALQLVKTNDVTDVQTFTQGNPVGIPGGLSVGILTGGASLVVGGGPTWTTNNWLKSVKLFNGSAIEFAGTGRSFGIGASGGNFYFSHANVDGSGAANYYMVADGTTGNMAIGGLPVANYKLTVDGRIGARSVKVVQGGWPDYVFHSNYQLPSLQEVETFVTTQHHLPGIPTAKEVKEEGLDLGEFDKQLLKKVEELTLYIIQLNKNVDSLNKQVAAQQEVIATLQKK